MSVTRVEKPGLQVDRALADFIDQDALPGTGVTVDAFWQAFGRLVRDFSPKNRELVAKRTELQGKIDAWHIARVGQPHDATAYIISDFGKTAASLL